MIGSPFIYCPACGATLARRTIELENRERLACPSCAFIHYQNPTPAAGVIVRDERGLLLVKRKFEPHKGGWTLPAGFIEAGEGADACAVREAKEETHLDVELTRIFGVYSAFDDPRASVILILYAAREVGGDLRCGDDASDARYFNLDELPRDIAFRAHVEAIADIKREVADGRL